MALIEMALTMLTVGGVSAAAVVDALMAEGMREDDARGIVRLVGGTFERYPGVKCAVAAANPLASRNTALASMDATR